MKNNYSFPAISFLLLAISCLCLSSCRDNHSAFSLLRVKIPEYDMQEYCNLLDNKNPGIVYSSICQLTTHADFMCVTLIAREYYVFAPVSPDSTAEPIDSSLYKISGTIYNKILPLVYSPNERIACAALRYFSEFNKGFISEKYKFNNSALLKHVSDQLLKVDLRTENIKLEFIHAIQALMFCNPDPFQEVANKLVHDNSWIISSYAYQLLSFSRDREILNTLKKKYPGATEFEKLLLLGGINDSCSDNVLDFLLASLKTENNPKAKLLLAKSLGKATNIESVCNWIQQNSASLMDIQIPLTNHFISQYVQTDNSNHIRILTTLFKANLISDSNVKDDHLFFYHVYRSLNDIDNEEGDSISKITAPYFRELVEQIASNDISRKYWNEYKESQLPKYSDEFMDAHQLLFDEFKRKAAKLFDEHKIDTTYKNPCLSSMDDVERTLRKETRLPEIH